MRRLLRPGPHSHWSSSLASASPRQCHNLVLTGPWAADCRGGQCPCSSSADVILAVRRKFKWGIAVVQPNNTWPDHRPLPPVPFASGVIEPALCDARTQLCLHWIPLSLLQHTTNASPFSFVPINKALILGGVLQEHIAASLCLPPSDRPREQPAETYALDYHLREIFSCILKAAFVALSSPTFHPLQHANQDLDVAEQPKTDALEFSLRGDTGAIGGKHHSAPPAYARGRSNDGFTTHARIVRGWQLYNYVRTVGKLNTTTAAYLMVKIHAVDHDLQCTSA